MASCVRTSGKESCLIRSAPCISEKNQSTNHRNWVVSTLFLFRSDFTGNVGHIYFRSTTTTAFAQEDFRGAGVAVTKREYVWSLKVTPAGNTTYQMRDIGERIELFRTKDSRVTRSLRRRGTSGRHETESWLYSTLGQLCLERNVADTCRWRWKKALRNKEKTVADLPWFLDKSYVRTPIMNTWKMADSNVLRCAKLFTHASVILRCFQELCPAHADCMWLASLSLYHLPHYDSGPV